MRTLAVRTAEIQRLFSGLSFTIQPCPIIYCSDHPILPCHSILHLLLLLLFFFYLTIYNSTSTINSTLLPLLHLQPPPSFPSPSLPLPFPFDFPISTKSKSLAFSASLESRSKNYLALSALCCLPPLYLYPLSPSLSLDRCCLLVSTHMGVRSRYMWICV